jgi:hypothetical protein
MFVVFALWIFTFWNVSVTDIKDIRTFYWIWKIKKDPSIGTDRKRGPRNQDPYYPIHLTIPIFD